MVKVISNMFEQLALCIIFALTIGLFLVRGRYKDLKGFPPGPKGFPILGHLPLLGQRAAETLLGWKKGYGPILGLKFGNIPTIVLNDAEMIQNAFSLKALSGRPDLKFLREIFKERKGMVCGDDPKSMEQRRFFYNHLKPASLERSGIEDLVLEEAGVCISRIEENLEGPVQLSNLFSASIFGTFWSLLMGSRIDSGDENLRTLLETLSRAQTFPKKLEILAMYVNWLKRFVGMDRFSLLIQGYNFLTYKFEEHRKSWVGGEEPRCITDHFLERSRVTTDEASSFHPKDLEYFLGSSFEVLIAGFDTTSASLEWLLLYLTTYPKVQAKFIKEILAVVGPLQRPALKDQASLPYVEATISEMLRMSSVGPLGLVHRAVESVKFEGYTIPKDAIVISNLYAVHHDPEVWGDPQNFRPERFLEGKESKMTAKYKDLLPFSTGRRRCIGESLARSQILLYGVSIYQKFRSEFCAGESPSLVGTNAIAVRPEPFRLIFRRHTS